MRALIFGDIFGRVGREALAAELPKLKEQYKPDILVANSENITTGKGTSQTHLNFMQDLGFSCLTGGNHTFAILKDLTSHWKDLGENAMQIRAANYFEHPKYPVPGRGYKIITTPVGRALVINLISGVFLHDNVDNPFIVVDRILHEFEEKGEIFEAILVDFHRETTAELACMAEFLSGRASLVYGTHTHVQTNDDRILPTGTAVITDVGMTGVEHSAIGQNFSARIPQLISGIKIFSAKAEPATGPAVVCGVFCEFEGGKCKHIEKIRIRKLA